MELNPEFDTAFLEEAKAELSIIEKGSEEVEKTTWTGAELFSLNYESVPTLIDPIVPSVGVWTICGSSDTGKSMLFRQLAISIAEGRDFIGFGVNAKNRKVLFIATEDDYRNTSFLLRKQAQTTNGLDNIRFHFETENIPDFITEQLTSEPVDLVIIDAWSDVFGENLNDTALIRKALNIYRSLANKFQCSIGFLHHTGKRTQKLAPSKDNILGGQGFEAKMRLVMELRNDVDDDDIKHLCIVKGNYLSKEFKNSSYKLEFDPETFLFSNTGERVPFEELSTPSEDSIGKKPPLLKAFEVDKGTHLENLKEVFQPGQLKRSELEARLSNQYEKYFGTVFGERRVRQYLEYLSNDLGLISKHGKDKSPNAYYFLTTDDITNDTEKCRQLHY